MRKREEFKSRSVVSDSLPLVSCAAQFRVSMVPARVLLFIGSAFFSLVCLVSVTVIRLWRRKLERRAGQLEKVEAVPETSNSKQPQGRAVIEHNLISSV